MRNNKCVDCGWVWIRIFGPKCRYIQIALAYLLLWHTLASLGHAWTVIYLWYLDRERWRRFSTRVKMSPGPSTSQQKSTTACSYSLLKLLCHPDLANQSGSFFSCHSMEYPGRERAEIWYQSWNGFLPMDRPKIRKSAGWNSARSWLSFWQTDSGRCWTSIFCGIWLE